MQVPNKQPTLPTQSRLAVIYETPLPHDLAALDLCQGPPGDFIYRLLMPLSLWRTNTFRGTLTGDSNLYVRTGKQTNLDWSLPSLARLREDLVAFQPNIVLLMGQAPLAYAGISHSITAFRGSLFQCTEPQSPFAGFKCLATYDIPGVFRDYATAPLARMDIRRAAEEADSPVLALPERNIAIHLMAHECIDRLNAITSGRVALDIEGGIPPAYNGITCISFATSPTECFVVRFKDFSEQEQARLIRAIGELLARPTVEKILQNSLYDNFVLSWLWRTPIRNVTWDTMLSGWEIYPELEKGLGVQASIWTKEPYYKFERKVSDDETHYRYCGKDSCVTFEIAEKHQVYLSLPSRSAQYDHFKFNMQLLPALHYMELRGIRYDVDQAAIARAETEVKMFDLQQQIDTELGQPLNVNSPKQMVQALYHIKKYPPQYKKEAGRKTTTLTADAEALLNLYRGTQEPFVHNILEWRQLEGIRKQLALSPDTDGRMRASYNLVGTDTGRLTCYESPTGNGGNLQTITKDLRKLYLADPGKILFQCDLSGADGWTVAAHCKAVGDSTMWEDYLAGLKPAKIISLMYMLQNAGRLREVLSASREQLRHLIDSTTMPKWLYDAAKAVQHGSNYMMRANTMSLNLLKQGWKKANAIVYVAPSDCALLQKLYLEQRYIGVPKWHQRVIDTLATKGQLSSASGNIRQFFGRSNDQNTQRSACSHEPQANTTYATNLAAHRLWHDPDNWDSRGLIIEPLHQVHDALVGQFPEDRLDWAINKLRTYFNNPITIAGQSLTIPFEGGYGPNWRDTTTMFA